MIKRMLASYCVLVSTLFLSHPVHALTESGLETITGQVKFEQRYTIVTNRHCENEPCSRSQAYWSLVIQSGNSRYLLNQRLNLGESRAPEYLEVAGVPLRPGSIVKLQAEVVYQSSQFYILSNIQNVRLLMDLGWSCHSIQGQIPSIHARLWYEAKNQDDGVFKIRVQKIKGDGFSQVAFIDRAVFIPHEENLIFGGTASQVQVEIQSSHETLLGGQKHFPARLKLSESGIAEQNLDHTSEVTMDCSQSRFSPYGGLRVE